MIEQQMDSLKTALKTNRTVLVVVVTPKNQTAVETGSFFLSLCKEFLLEEQ